ncbi:MAG: three-Cys-motif partner protein TcmP [Sphaerochaetaceae bacterium]|nr:three-Cys-motif partner protein TcmP [uncultured Sphaerochaeta sp.]MDC7229091.1 three-Cys-motif partner protein TcmP [Sphaerochaetaceae bacterium]
MGKVTCSFFNDKKDWSKAKDDLLKHYLNAYLVKLFCTGKPTIYLDCFAGAGKFGEEDTPYEDKVDGSPLIALEAISKATAKSSVYKPTCVACFIEPCYPEMLKINIEKSFYSDVHYRLFAGTFPEEAFMFLDNVFKHWQNPNLFCYLDPFGVKYLKMNALLQIKNHPFNSIEFLINFNSFGFLRYACGVSAIRETELREAEVGSERETMDDNPKEDRLCKLDAVMGTDAWRSIVEDYKQHIIDGYDAEMKLAELYKLQLKKVLGFRYVLSIPIRFNESNHPKYRMVYATNHEDGAVIMGDVMRGRQNYLYEQYSMSKSGGCLGLFDREDLLNRPSVEESVVDFLKGKGELTGNEFFAGFYDEKFLTAKLIDVLKKLEECNKITIRRDPENTKKKKPSRFYTEAKNQHLFIRLNG